MAYYAGNGDLAAGAEGKQVGEYRLFEGLLEIFDGAVHVGFEVLLPPFVAVCPHYEPLELASVHVQLERLAEDHPSPVFVEVT